MVKEFIKQKKDKALPLRRGGAEKILDQQVDMISAITRSGLAFCLPALTLPLYDLPLTSAL